MRCHVQFRVGFNGFGTDRAEPYLELIVKWTSDSQAGFGKDVCVDHCCSHVAMSE